MAIFTMLDETPGGAKPGSVELLLTTDGPARFSISVDEGGHVHVFGYSGCENDDDQDPNVVFDTDGSLAVFTDAEA